MATAQQTTALEALILMILEGGTRDSAYPFGAAWDHMSSLVRMDYGAAMRRHFDAAQMRQIVASLCKSIPGLNSRVLATTDLKRLAEIADRLGARLVPNRFSGRQGRDLRGFYSDVGMFRRRPLICVNTTNHPVAVAAAFWHEVGHHLGRRILDRSGVRALSFTTEYPEHLDSMSETIADIVMVLGGYPRSAARRLFDDGRRDLVDGDLLVDRARGHLRSISFEFQHSFSAHENLCYLAGMIHLAKLRSALLREFGV